VCVATGGCSDGGPLGDAGPAADSGNPGDGGASPDLSAPAQDLAAPTGADLGRVAANKSGGCELGARRPAGALPLALLLMIAGALVRSRVARRR
jgi:hypothetical protein